MSETFRIFFEDLVVGEVQRFGRYEVLREEAIDFARNFDPQDFHLTDEAAARGPFGRLAVSGWHTCGMAMRMVVDHMHETGFASMGGAGIEELRWLVPVYPGDVLRVESVVTAKRRSRSRPEMGLFHQLVTLFNQHDVAVMRYAANAMAGLRDPAAAFEV